MNYLAIDYGTKKIGLAYSQNGIISPLPVIANTKDSVNKIVAIVSQYSISKIFVGLPEWGTKDEVKIFVVRLSSVLQLPVETVEEAVSTIEADLIFKDNKKKRKLYRQSIDSVAAAVILRRVIR